jgi:hypothetical protein
MIDLGIIASQVVPFTWSEVFNNDSFLMPGDSTTYVRDTTGPSGNRLPKPRMWIDPLPNYAYYTNTFSDVWFADGTPYPVVVTAVQDLSTVTNIEIGEAVYVSSTDQLFMRVD